MPVPFAPLSIQAPGSYGLNKQRSNELEPQWATVATNCVFDHSGNLAARNGWEEMTTSPIAGTPSVDAIAPYLKADGTLEIISAANNKLYEGTTTLTELTAASFTTPTDDNWKMVNFMDKLYGFQIGHTPWEYDGTNVSDLTDVNAPAADEVLAAFGRLWACNTSTDKTTVWYSDIIDGLDWTTGTTGSIDLDLWLAGTDNVVALRGFNGYLIVFCLNTIMVFENPDDPNAATFGLVETITGVGCIARDSIQDTGSDILFLSSRGVLSLGRVIQEKSMPFNTISTNVEDDFKLYAYSETANLIRSAFHPREGFYIINFPTYDKTYYFDMKRPLGDGTYRATRWEGINPSAMVYVETGDTSSELYLGQAGSVGRYKDFTDNGTGYTFSYRSPWLSFGDASRTKLLKRLRATVGGGYSYTINFKYGFDYSESEYVVVANQLTTATPAEYGIAEYNIAEYSGSIANTDTQVPLTHSGSVVRFGLDVVINGSDFNIHRIALYAKAGRVI